MCAINFLNMHSAADGTPGIGMSHATVKLGMGTGGLFSSITVPLPSGPDILSTKELETYNYKLRSTTIACRQR
jgi:hypothetical protein